MNTKSHSKGANGHTPKDTTVPAVGKGPLRYSRRLRAGFDFMADRKKSKGWNDSYYVKSFRLAQEGKTDTRISKILGIHVKTFKKYVKTKPALKAALEAARGTGGVATFHEYVFNRLDPNLQETWNRIKEWETAKDGYQRTIALLDRRGMRVRQDLFLHALVSTNFCVSEACRMVLVSKRTFHDWITTDERFAELIEEMQWHKKNFFEGALMGLVAEGDTHAVIFANKTQNADRGYSEKKEHTHTIAGRIEHDHTIVNIDDMKLPLETRKQILSALRDKQKDALGIGHVKEAETIDAEYTVAELVPKVGKVGE